MFNGIIQNQGIVKSRKADGGQIRLGIRFKKSEKNLSLGESIAVNGVCLTVAKKSGNSFTADIVNETLRATTLGRLKAGDVVNLERSLRYGDLVGGHFISGHVDGIGKILKIKKSGKNQVWTISTPASIKKYITRKGSAAIDGISLTVQSASPRSFTIALIPHTLKETTLHRKKAGDFLNIEADMLARYGRLKEMPVPVSKSLKQPASVIKQIRRMKIQGF